MRNFDCFLKTKIYLSAHKQFIGIANLFLSISFIVMVFKLLLQAEKCQEEKSFSSFYWYDKAFQGDDIYFVKPMKEISHGAYWVSNVSVKCHTSLF